MNFATKGPPLVEGDPLEELSSLGGVDLTHNQAPAQAENDPAQFTCASMRADELRGCLVRAIACAAIHGSEAQIALLDGDDDAALANLRRHWIATRTGIAPLAGELAALRRAGAAP
jgi:hypothetical protein